MQTNRPYLSYATARAICKAIWDLVPCRVGGPDGGPYHIELADSAGRPILTVIAAGDANGGFHITYPQN